MLPITFIYCLVANILFRHGDLDKPFGSASICFSFLLLYWTRQTFLRENHRKSTANSSFTFLAFDTVGNTTENGKTKRKTKTLMHTFVLLLKRYAYVTYCAHKIVVKKYITDNRKIYLFTTKHFYIIIFLRFRFL